MMTLVACRDLALVIGSTFVLAACQPSTPKRDARAEAATVVADAQTSTVAGQSNGYHAKSYGTAEFLVRKKIDETPTLVATSGPKFSAAQAASEKALNPAALASANHVSVAREASEVKAVDLKR